MEIVQLLCMQLFFHLGNSPGNLNHFNYEIIHFNLNIVG